jgi:ubiquinone/menaquinone biosynthesis C-methylase UbiE
MRASVEVKAFDGSALVAMVTNRGLRRAYTLWATFYDPVVRPLRWSRRRSLALLDLHAGETLLILGCGTGADFEFVPRDVEVTAVDIIIRLLEMDAMDLRFPDATFGKTVLHLILAVVPDPVRTLQEAERVTKPNGLLVVMDKLWPTRFWAVS